MRYLNLKYCIIFFVLIANLACTKKVSVESLLSEMINRDGLAEISDLEFKTLQASSYSRQSISANQEGWFDNADASQFVRVDTIDERIEHVLLDAEGPGAIVRFWSTWHAQQFSMGTLRFYFDNSPTPQIEGRIDEIISSNKLVGTPLSQTASPFLENDGWFSGHNLYFPLPYAKHCKVTYQKADEKVNDVLYYQINYREYPKGTSVETYEKAGWGNGKYAEALNNACALLQQPEHIASDCKVFHLNGSIKPGKYLSTSIMGEQAIKRLSIKIKADNMEQALRSTVISMEFDGEKTVWVPLGDFFGTGYKISTYQSWYSSVDKDGEMTTYFPMPFKKSAKLTIHNFGKEDVELIKMDLYSSVWKWDERSLYFHANWKNYPNIGTAEKQDVNYITISGKGKYVGDALTLFNDSYSWWGEGDEKIYVDDEKFPSHFGTGTEDYYGYAWCSVVNFSAPFIAQPIGDGNRSPGLTVNSRYRALDIIPFNKSLKFDIEIWHWADTQMDYAPTTFWYGTYNSKAEHLENVKGVQLPVKLSDKFEGESFTLKKVDGGEVIIQAFLSSEWSARNHLLWRGINENDKLETTFYSEKERNGELNIVFTHAPDYVIVDVYLNGELVFSNLDLYSGKLSLKDYTNETGHIIKGNNELTLVVKGASKLNPNADKLGLDYLRIE